MVNKILCAAILANLLTGCAKYSVAVNDNTVYTPPPIFTAFSTPDRNLQRCIDATIKENHLTQAEQLKRLFCPNSEIKNLNGIEIFKGIVVLDLSNNQIVDITPIKALQNVKQVNLAGNAIETLAPLANNKKLEQVLAAKNAKLECDSTVPLKHIKELSLPTHCNN